MAVIVAFLVFESRTDHPSMDLSLFRIRSFSVPLAGTSLTFAALTGTLIFLAFYYQVVRGWSPLQSGALTVPFAVGQILAAPRSGKMVARFGARRVIPFGLVLASLAMFVFTRLTLDTPVWVLVIIPFVFGFGMGNVVAPSTTRMTLATPPQRSGAGSAVQNTVRQVGATLGVAVISSVVATKYSGAMSSALEGSPLPPDLRDVAADSVGATYEVAGRLQASGQASPEQVDALRAAADTAFMSAFHVAAYMGLGLLLTALAIFLLWLPAQAEAVAWRAGGTSAPLRPAAGRRAAEGDGEAAAEGLDAAHQVHVVAEDPDHLGHVDEAPLEHPRGGGAHVREPDQR